MLMRATYASQKIAQLLATIPNNEIRADVRDYVEGRSQVMREQLRNVAEAIDELAYRELVQMFVDAGRQLPN